MRNKEELSLEAQAVIDRIEQELAPAHDYWENSDAVKSWNNLDHTTEADKELIIDVIGEALITRLDLIGQATSAAITGMLTIIPNWLTIKIAVTVFKQILDANPKTARRALNEFSLPVDNHPFIPDSVKNLHAKICERLELELE
jgi:hypothetical protein